MWSQRGDETSEDMHSSGVFFYSRGRALNSSCVHLVTQGWKRLNEPAWGSSVEAWPFDGSRGRGNPRFSLPPGACSSACAMPIIIETRMIPAKS